MKLDEFIEKFKPEIQDSGEKDFISKYIIETKEKLIEKLDGVEVEYVWTIMDLRTKSEDPHDFSIVPGYITLSIGSMGWILCKNRWEESNEIVKIV